jgi:hypothetical protein
MSLRLAHVRRKDYQTEERELSTGIPYLVWTKYPKERKLIPSNSLGVRVWPAGSGPSEVWTVKEYFEPGTKGWGDGGYEIEDKYGVKSQVFMDELIIHPKVKTKKKRS